MTGMRATGNDTDHRQVADVVAAIWEDLLGCRPRREDDFFELGGHSLVAARATTKTRHALGISLTMDLLYEHSTLTDYVNELVELCRATDAEDLAEGMAVG